MSVDELDDLDADELREIIAELEEENARLRDRAERWRSSRDEMALMFRESITTHRAHWNVAQTQIAEMRDGTLTAERQAEVADEFLEQLPEEIRKRYERYGGLAGDGRP